MFVFRKIFGAKGAEKGRTETDRERTKERTKERRKLTKTKRERGRYVTPRENSSSVESTWMNPDEENCIDAAREEDKTTTTTTTHERRGMN